MALVAAFALFAGGADEAHGDGGGRIFYDRGPVLVPAWSPLPLPLAIDFFTDSFGPPAAKWTADAIPVEFCTMQNQRPAAMTADQVRDAVQEVFDAWNVNEAAVGVRYTGDCTAGFRFEFDNDRNEIGFDDSRNLATGTEAGLARGSWFNIPTSANPERREFIEFDIVLEGSELVTVPFVCFQSVLAHELGHALGFGHSDDENDLMFESFDPQDLDTCRIGPSAAEAARMQDLYGVDRPPSANAGADRIVDPEASVALTASGSDPEGESLTFQWAQLSGTDVGFSVDGTGITFDAPSVSGEVLIFELVAVDPFLHRGSDTVSVTVAGATSPPALAPSFASFLPGPAGDAELGWKAVSGASSYEFCTSPPGAPESATCSNVPASVATIDWDVTLGTQGLATSVRTFTGTTGGVRDSWLRACNSKGCSTVGVGPLAGGLRWPAWEVDYDYFVLAFDFGRLQFTIVGVVNVSGPRRAFTFYTGPEDDPQQFRIRKCGLLPAGAACIDFLGPDDDHFAIGTIVSTRSGAPTTEHYITIR